MGYNPIIPVNETAEVPIRWTENSLYFVTNRYTIGHIPEPLPAAGIFKCNILGKKGGTIIGTVAVVYVTDGSDSLFTEERTIAQLTAFLAGYDAGTSPLPGYYELFFSSDGSEEAFKIWWNGPILISRSGS